MTEFAFKIYKTRKEENDEKEKWKSIFFSANENIFLISQNPYFKTGCDEGIREVKVKDVI